MRFFNFSFRIDLNKYDFFIILIIASLAYGEFEALGAFTPIRLMGVCSVFYIIKNWKKLLKSGFASWVEFLIFWWVCMTVSLLWTPDINLALIYWFHFTCIIGCFLALFISTMKAKSPLMSFSTGWLIFVLITIPIAIWEITSGDHLSSGSFNVGQIRADGNYRIFAAVTFANLNSYSLMLTYTLPFLILLIWNNSIKKVKWFRLFVWLIFCLVFVVLIINSSRAAFVCLFSAIVLMIVFRFKYYNTLQRLLLGGIVTTLVILLISNLDEIEIFYQLFSRLDGHNMFADSNRIGLIKVGLNIAQDNLYFGGGTMSMIPLYQRYNADFNYAHNMLIEMLVEHGALICVIFIALFIKLLKRIKKVAEMSYQFLFYYVLVSIVFMIIIDDYYFVRSGYWIYLASIISLSQIPYLNKR
ncbi:MAG: hypothetical protein BHV68_04150 [Bacteroidales bacterium 43_8]|nr:MAG: hypothetical protein BHV68_04150 [Bacteroidales bacterium 43_8]